jgi:hypothetical protein
MRSHRLHPTPLAAGAVTVASLIGLVACGSSSHSTAAGPSATRAAALHAAAECIRQHGIPNFVDPTVSPDGHVYTDTRSLENADDATQQAARRACQDLVAAADWNPSQQPPAPPALVAAGVRAAQCMRAHGLPNYRDPTPDTPYTPGHGFGLTADEVPAGGKQSAGFQEASRTCGALISAEIEASRPENLAKQ